MMNASGYNREGGFVAGWDGLPEKLRSRLCELSAAYRKEGLELFLFGSFARGDNRPASDLDLGVDWHRTPSRAIFTRLWNEVEELPTIRKIDLVDLAEASSELRRMALSEKKAITDRRNGEERKS